MPRILDAAYFEKNAKKLFQLRLALKNQKHLGSLNGGTFQQGQFWVNLIRSGLKVKSDLSMGDLIRVRHFVDSQGGIEAFSNKSLIINNVYIAMAVYNLKIQKEIIKYKQKRSYVNMNVNQAKRLLTKLLNEEVVDESAGKVYNDICKCVSYKRAEPAVRMYVKKITNEQAESVKNFLRDYLNNKIQSLLRSCATSNRRAEVSE